MAEINKNISEEIWLGIPNYPNYEISSFGRVKRLKISVNRIGGQRFMDECIMKPYPDGGGYLMADLRNSDGKKRPKVHRLVAKLFIPNPENLPEVNHINSDLNDNSIYNLEWCTRGQNQKHAVINNRYKHKLSFQDVINIRRMVFEFGYKQIEVAKAYMIHQSHVNKIIKNTRRLIQP